MRFACQSCGKAYNLPEDRIAEKSNVKLKCRVCGAIVEVKKQGELVAQILNEGEGKRGGRGSEAPGPLMSMNPDEPDEATQAISFSETGFPSLPLPSLGFGASSLGASALAPPASVSRLDPPPLRAEPPPSAFAPPLPAQVIPALPYISNPVSPPPPPLGMPEIVVPDMPVLNGSHASPPALGADAMRLPEDILSPVASKSLANADLGLAEADYASPGSGGAPSTAPEGAHSTSMLLAAFATGILVGVIIALMFF